MNTFARNESACKFRDGLSFLRFSLGQISELLRLTKKSYCNLKLKCPDTGQHTVIIFGSSDLFIIVFIEQLLALVGSLSLASGHDCILSLLRLGRFSKGLLINISSKNIVFVRVFTLTILWISAILKLDFLKSPVKSGSARPPRGVKLGNSVQPP